MVFPFLVCANGVKGQICTFPQFFCGKVAKGVEKCSSFFTVFDSFAQNWWKMHHNRAVGNQRKQVRWRTVFSEQVFDFFQPATIHADDQFWQRMT